MNPVAAFEEMQRLSRLIDAGIEALREQSRTLAEAERTYRKAKAEAWVKVPRDGTDDKTQRNWTAGRREAWVDAETADQPYERDVADGMRQAALEAVRARRTQISALQTLLNAEAEEAKLVRTGPQ